MMALSKGTSDIIGVKEGTVDKPRSQRDYKGKRLEARADETSQLQRLRIREAEEVDEAGRVSAIMEEIIPWDEWTAFKEPYYPKGERGRTPRGIETMVRMYLLQCWFNLSDEGVEDAIYDSYAMRKFMGINFMEEQAPDATTLCKFRHLLEKNGIGARMFTAIRAGLRNTAT